MNVIRVDKNNMVNGCGLRCVIWCAGCEHNCLLCQNKEAQNPEIGTAVGPWLYDDIKEQLDSKEIAGVTFTGGECTYKDNIEESTKIMKWIKENYPKKNIWVYTGYTYEEIKDLEMMKYIDVLVDGKYVDDLNPGNGKLKWRGSSNQRVIDMNATRKENKVVWLKDFNGKFIYENENIEK